MLYISYYIYYVIGLGAGDLQKYDFMVFCEIFDYLIFYIFVVVL